MENKQREHDRISKGKIFDTLIHGVKELPEEERDFSWRVGVWFYSIAVPFVWISTLIFYTTNMNENMLCTIAEASDNPYPGN